MISELGAVSCTTISYPYGAVPVCSPLSWILNGSYAIAGLLLIGGAYLIKGWLPRGGWAVASIVLLMISGASLSATGLVPLDVNLELHALVAIPSLVTMPAALIALSLALRARDTGLSRASGVVGGVSMLCAIGFIAWSTTEPLGWLERAAIWPPTLMLTAIGVTGLRSLSRDQDHSGAAQ